jgi:hypothetical protein
MHITLRVTSGPHLNREFAFEGHDNFIVYPSWVSGVNGFFMERMTWGEYKGDGEKRCFPP